MTGNTRRLHLTLLASTDECAVLRAAGELDVHAEPRFLADAGELVDSGRHYLVLDLTALTFCDSRGLNCLLALDWLCRRFDGRLLLASAGSRLLQLLEQTRVRDRLGCYPTVGQAFADVPAALRPEWPPPPQAAEPEQRGRQSPRPGTLRPEGGRQPGESG